MSTCLCPSVVETSHTRVGLVHKLVDMGSGSFHHHCAYLEVQPDRPLMFPRVLLGSERLTFRVYAVWVLASIYARNSKVEIGR
jgi:hypothetical protein